MEIGTLDFLLKAQKNHLAHLTRTRIQGRVHGRCGGAPQRILQPWPTGQMSSSHKRRHMRGVSVIRSFSKRARMNNMPESSVSLPVDNKNDTGRPEIASNDQDVKKITALLEKKVVIPPTKLLPGGKKPLQTVDLTLELDDSAQNSLLNQSEMTHSGFDQSMQSQTLDLDQSALDELPSEASFSRHLEDRPDTACSTPAKPDASQSENDSITQQGKTPKRKLRGLDQSGEENT